MKHLSSLFALLPLAVLFAPADARACGGCFHEESAPSQSPSVITDHRMVLAITPTLTTLWDQVEYAGDPSGFAWVLPIRGRVVVGLGSDKFINALDTNTAPTIVAPPSTCSAPALGGGSVGCGAQSDSESGAYSPTTGEGTGWQEDSGVYITDRSTVGPYDTVQIHGKDAGGILAWLRNNKYSVPTELEPMLQKYVDEGFDFVAVRLRPGYGVQAMRPIRVSFKGAYPSLPLRMVRAGVGERVGIKLFVVGEGRWKTSNFPTLSIDPKMLTWDWAQGRSDYTTVRAKESAKLDDRAFVLESSIDMNAGSIPYDPSPSYPTTDSGAAPATDTGSKTDSALDAEAATDAAEAETDPDAGVDDAAADTAATDSGAADTAATDAGADTAPPDYDAGEKPNVDPYASDLEVAWGSRSSRRVTRLRADLPAKFLDVDLVLEADENQNAMQPTLRLTRGINEVCTSDGGGGRSDTCDCTVPTTGSFPRIPVGLCATAIAVALVRRRLRR